jgi:hypothetical protein
METSQLNDSFGKTSFPKAQLIAEYSVAASISQHQHAGSRRSRVAHSYQYRRSLSSSEKP